MDVTVGVVISAFVHIENRVTSTLIYMHASLWRAVDLVLLPWSMAYQIREWISVTAPSLPFTHDCEKSFCELLCTVTHIHKIAHIRQMQLAPIPQRNFASIWQGQHKQSTAAEATQHTPSARHSHAYHLCTTLNENPSWLHFQQYVTKTTTCAQWCIISAQGSSQLSIRTPRLLQLIVQLIVEYLKPICPSNH